MASCQESPTVIRAPAPPPQDPRLLHSLLMDVKDERAARRRGGYPAGSLRPSLRNTQAIVFDPLTMLLEHHRRHGPVFTIRHLHVPVVWAVGAHTNHQMLVSDADAFSWREGRFRDLHPLLGDGMLNIDGAYHRQMRALLLPPFHRGSVEEAATTMVAEAVAAAEQLQPGTDVDLYAWTRQLAMRIATRGLLGLDAGAERERELADAFEAALSFHGHPLYAQVLRGPGTPFARAERARARLNAIVHSEIDERRRRGDLSGLLGLLLGATDDTGRPLDRVAVRDQAVTLLFAGHDTTTATFTFLAYEVGRSAAARAALESELATVLGDSDPTPAQLDGATLPVLERTIDETLRRYPPAWVGPRRTTRAVELAGVRVPAGVPVHYSSWATHHLEELYPSPFAFEPDRFLPERARLLPKGAYIPFGGGSRMCLGKRFGQYELRAIAAVLLRRLRLDPDPSRPLRIATTPTLGPHGGLKFRVSCAVTRTSAQVLGTTGR